MLVIDTHSHYSPHVMMCEWPAWQLCEQTWFVIQCAMKYPTWKWK